MDTINSLPKQPSINIELNDIAPPAQPSVNPIDTTEQPTSTISKQLKTRFSKVINLENYSSLSKTHLKSILYYLFTQPNKKQLNSFIQKIKLTYNQTNDLLQPTIRLLIKNYQESFKESILSLFETLDPTDPNVPQHIALTVFYKQNTLTTALTQPFLTKATSLDIDNFTKKLSIHVHTLSALWATKNQFRFPKFEELSPEKKQLFQSRFPDIKTSPELQKQWETVCSLDMLNHQKYVQEYLGFIQEKSPLLPDTYNPSSKKISLSDFLEAKTQCAVKALKYSFLQDKDHNHHINLLQEINTQSSVYTEKLLNNSALSLSKIISKKASIIKEDIDLIINYIRLDRFLLNTDNIDKTHLSSIASLLFKERVDTILKIGQIFAQNGHKKTSLFFTELLNQESLNTLPTLPKNYLKDSLPNYSNQVSIHFKAQCLNAYAHYAIIHRPESVDQLYEDLISLISDLPDTTEIANTFIHAVATLQLINQNKKIEIPIPQSLNNIDINGPIKRAFLIERILLDLEKAIVQESTHQKDAHLLEPIAAQVKTFSDSHTENPSIQHKMLITLIVLGKIQSINEAKKFHKDNNQPVQNDAFYKKIFNLVSKLEKEI